jgi:hypothetical protein
MQGGRAPVLAPAPPPKPILAYHSSTRGGTGFRHGSPAPTPVAASGTHTGTEGWPLPAPTQAPKGGPDSWHQHMPPRDACTRAVAQNKVRWGRGGRPWGVGVSLCDRTYLRFVLLGFRADCFRCSLLFFLIRFFVGGGNPPPHFGGITSPQFWGDNPPAFWGIIPH